MAGLVLVACAFGIYYVINENNTIVTMAIKPKSRVKQKYAPMATYLNNENEPEFHAQQIEHNSYMGVPKQYWIRQDGCKAISYGNSAPRIRR
jgi:hypothetical protein